MIALSSNLEIHLSSTFILSENEIENYFRIFSDANLTSEKRSYVFSTTKLIENSVQ